MNIKVLRKDHMLVVIRVNFTSFVINDQTMLCDLNLEIHPLAFYYKCQILYIFCAVLYVKADLYLFIWELTCRIFSAVVNHLARLHIVNVNISWMSSQIIKYIFFIDLILYQNILVLQKVDLLT